MEFRPRRKTSIQFEDSPKKKRIEKKDTFDIGERILCYEPNEKLEKVLYDAKVLNIIETKDKRGKKSLEYQIHFQGWKRSWDRRVSEDFVLKDTPDNRKLQQELAEKSQLQLGVYLYRKERKKLRKLNERNKLQNDFTDSDIKKEKDTDRNNDLEVEYYSSSATESNHDEDRVFLHMGDTLKAHLENDHKMVTKQKMFVVLPAVTPVITILENFVKIYSIKLLTGPSDELKSKRRSCHIKKETKIIDYESLQTKINLCKETADGLRIYFNFTFKEFLLYSDEKDFIEKFMSDENLKKLKLERKNELKLDEYLRKELPTITVEQEQFEAPGTPHTERKSSRLRSYSCRTDEESNIESKYDNISSMASTSSGESTTLNLTPSKRFQSRSVIPRNIILNPIAKKILENVFQWKMVPDDAEPEPSMIFGINHLLRLVVKLPEFLSSTPISEEKLLLLLKFLDAFVEYLEENEQYYGEQNYMNAFNDDLSNQSDNKMNEDDNSSQDTAPKADEEFDKLMDVSDDNDNKK